MMIASIAPWSPYEGRTDIASHGRRSLTAAFADFVQVSSGALPFDLPDIFAAPSDEAEDDANRELVQLDAEELAAQFLSGCIATYARPMLGGQVSPIGPDLWEIDDPLARFATGAFNLVHWADPSADLTHRIFVDADQFDRWLARLPKLGPLSDREIKAVLDPQVRAARAVASRDAPPVLDPGVTPEDRPRLIPDALGVGPVLLKLPEVAKMVSQSGSSIYAKMGRGEFPKPIKVGSGSRWLETEIRQWIGERAARRG